MQFLPTRLAGAVVVRIEPQADARGFFARAWCAREFAAHGMPAQFVQASISRNTRRGTVRGLHLQLPPSQEGKLVSCIAGSIHDVIVDLRPDSPTFLGHFGLELSAATHQALYIPPLVAHGFQTLADDTEVLYLMTDYFAPELGFGVRWNDPAFAISWPMASASAILPRDAGYPDFDAAAWRGRLAAARGKGGAG
ncbi:MAG TPA: dTDP-4-dehydrorhamnose 3,5-epimerase family protein [Steroidobacteraceae bacterium]|nr:dTDP-4-dehydrorhamnose 3,5-epimerase family protein [Steroidobacteraceae bacterium]